MKRRSLLSVFGCCAISVALLLSGCSQQPSSPQAADQFTGRWGDGETIYDFNRDGTGAYILKDAGNERGDFKWAAEAGAGGTFTLKIVPSASPDDTATSTVRFEGSDTLTLEESGKKDHKLKRLK